MTIQTIMKTMLYKENVEVENYILSTFSNFLRFNHQIKCVYKLNACISLSLRHYHVQFTIASSFNFRQLQYDYPDIMKIMVYKENFEVESYIRSIYFKLLHLINIHDLITPFHWLKVLPI